MRYQEYDLNHALGIRLADEIRLNGRTLPKGRELTAEDIRLAARALGKITGRIEVNEILDKIFGDFCIGK